MTNSSYRNVWEHVHPVHPYLLALNKCHPSRLCQIEISHVVDDSIFSLSFSTEPKILAYLSPCTPAQLRINNDSGVWAKYEMHFKKKTQVCWSVFLVIMKYIICFPLHFPPKLHITSSILLTSAFFNHFSFSLSSLYESSTKGDNLISRNFKFKLRNISSIFIYIWYFYVWSYFLNQEPKNFVFDVLYPTMTKSVFWTFWTLRVLLKHKII